MVADPVLLDSGVVIALGTESDAHHQAVVEALNRRVLGRHPIAVSAVTYCEALVHAAKRGRERLDDASRALDALCDVKLDVNRSAAVDAAALRAKHKWLATEDALIIASGRAAGIAEVLTTDRELARLSRVRYIGA